MSVVAFLESGGVESPPARHTLFSNEPRDLHFVSSSQTNCTLALLHSPFSLFLGREHTASSSHYQICRIDRRGGAGGGKEEASILGLNKMPDEMCYSLSALAGPV
ncbi:uncharacterized [Tachysurus ichikawai]